MNTVAKHSIKGVFAVAAVTGMLLGGSLPASANTSAPTQASATLVAQPATTLGAVTVAPAALDVQTLRSVPMAVKKYPVGSWMWWTNCVFNLRLGYVPSGC